MTLPTDLKPRHIPVCAGVRVYLSASDYCPVYPVSSYYLLSDPWAPYEELRAFALQRNILLDT